MQKYKIYRCLFLLLSLALYTGSMNAQDKISENRTIKVKKNVLCQIDFTTEVSAEFSLPKNSTDYYALGDTRAQKSLTINTLQENPPATILTVTEVNGKKWNITVEYKADLDPENEDETNYDFSDNNIKAARTNIVLKETDQRLSSEKQGEPIPYSVAEMGQLNKTYPGIDFTQPPPEQTINLAFENDIAFIDRLYNNRRTEIIKAFKNDMVSIRIVCQDISFNGTNAYLKLLLQNDGTEDFLTGSMLLTLVRPNGTSLSLHPGKIHPAKFPIIRPKSQIAIIYPFKAFHVADEESLKFEIQDRTQKINLEFNLTGVDYNEARKD